MRPIPGTTGRAGGAQQLRAYRSADAEKRHTPLGNCTHGRQQRAPNTIYQRRWRAARQESFVF